VPRSPQDGPDREAEVPREIVCLVEASTGRPPPRQGNWDHRVRSVEHLAAGLAHQASQRVGKRPTAFVLEGVDDVPKRSIVPPGAPCDPDERCAAAASRAKRMAGVERWHRVTAAGAAGRGQPRDLAPAPLTGRAVERPVERLAAGRAVRRQEHADHGI
jgi:hypothetical protein